VTGLLETHFPHLVDTKFTSKMERTLDQIAEGEAEWLPYLKEFYLGQEGLRQQVADREKAIDPAAARTIDLGGLPDATIRIGRFGPFAEVLRDGETVRASLPPDAAPADLTMAHLEKAVKQKLEGPDQLGVHPESGETIYILTGQYGPYVQLGEVVEGGAKPKRASLPKGVTPETMTLDMAVGLLALPRHLGEHPEQGGKVMAGLGRFGPYIVHDRGKEGKDYRSIKGEDDVLTIQLPRALEMLAQPKQGRGRRTAAKPLKEIGAHPADKEPVNLHDGQYGPYVKHGKVSASIPKGRDPMTVTLEEAVELLAAKAGAPKTRVKRKATKTKAKSKSR
jgi:DNA topoisomerase-1